MILTCYIGIGSVYVVFISGIVQKSFDTAHVIDQGYYALMLFPLLFVMNMVRHLSDMTLASVAGNLLILCTVVIGIVYALKDGFGEKWLMISPDIRLYPKFIGMVFFSMISPGVVSLNLPIFLIKRSECHMIPVNYTCKIIRIFITL